jgi:hypothetical protein
MSAHRGPHEELDTHHKALRNSQRPVRARAYHPSHERCGPTVCVFDPPPPSSFTMARRPRTGARTAERLLRLLVVLVLGEDF